MTTTDKNSITRYRLYLKGDKVEKDLWWMILKIQKLMIKNIKKF